MPPQAKRLTPEEFAKPMWTMIAHHPTKRHIATDTFIGLCGRRDLLVRDYVELKDGKVLMIGEGRCVVGVVDEYTICKQCLSALRKRTSKTTPSTLTT